jgi:hypothetical protein
MQRNSIQITDFWILDESYSSQDRFSADEILTFEWDTQSFIYNKYSQLFICVSRYLWCNKLYISHNWYTNSYKLAVVFFIFIQDTVTSNFLNIMNYDFMKVILHKTNVNSSPLCIINIRRNDLQMLNSIFIGQYLIRLMDPTNTMWL